MQDQLAILVVTGGLIVAGVVFAFYKYKKALLGEIEPAVDQTAIKEEVLKVVPFPVVLLTGRYTVVYLNPSAEALLRSPLRRNLGKPVSALFELRNPQTKLPITDFLDACYSNGATDQAPSISCIARDQNGSETWMSVTAVTIEENPDPQLGQYALFLEDATATRAVKSQLNYIERHDGATGLLNRKAFESVLKAVTDDSKKHGSTHVLMTLSIDQFKTINDAAGYAAGDFLINKVVGLLKEVVNGGEDSTLGRLMGSDFGIIFKETSLAAA
ncbi:MAG: diguanylate cyclase domain-containing protein, partial [Leucothrix sp.]